MNSSESSKCSSSRSSSLAPQDFNISNQMVDNHFSSHEIQSNTLIINESIKQLMGETEAKSRSIGANNKKYYLRCVVCCRDKSIFFCSDCIKNGDFTYSKQRIPERFAEKKFKCFKLKSEQMIISDRIDNIFNNCFIRDDLEFKIRSIESNIEELKKNVINLRQTLNSSENNLKKTKLSQNECNERTNKLISKVKDAKHYLIRRQNSITKMYESKDNYNSYIKDLVQQRVQQLTTYIFPIEAKDTINENNEINSILNSETTPLLEPMSSDSNNFIINYSIVEPWINGNGDYSAFALFASNERDLPNRESNFRNPKYRMCAALAYVTQMIYIIAFYLDIRLPKRISYSEFFNNDLNECQFAQKVAKLNVNILYLCISQNIDQELLGPRQTIKNLLHLLHSSNCLGIRNRPIVIRNDFFEFIEEVLSEDMYLIDETEAEDSGNDQNDENLIIEYDWVENNLPDLQLNMSSQQTSIASGVISTFASVWKAFQR